jgi:ABC-2 type transport system permease protein
MKQFLIFLQKEFFHVFRDQKTLLLLFGLPIAQILLFGFALTNEIKNSKVVIFDYAKDAQSQSIIEKLRSSKTFKIEQAVWHYEALEQAFKKGDIKMALVFPANFGSDLEHLHKAQVQVIADASDPNSATTLNAYMSNIIVEHQQALMQEQGMPYTISTETRMIYNPELKGTTNFVPGVMALVLLLVCVLMTSVSIVKEKESGTMELLLVSPINPFLIIVSKALPYLLLSMVNLATILLMSVYLLDTPIKGSVVLLFAESTLFIFTALSLGLLISNITASQQAAMLISLMGMLVPSLLFTGFMFPLENMPLPLQIISNIVPSKWYYIIVKSVMIKGLGIEAVWKETLVLLGMTLFLLALSLKNFKHRLS